MAQSPNLPLETFCSRCWTWAVITYVSLGKGHQDRVQRFHYFTTPWTETTCMYTNRSKWTSEYIMDLYELWRSQLEKLCTYMFIRLISVQIWSRDFNLSLSNCCRYVSWEEKGNIHLNVGKSCLAMSLPDNNICTLLETIHKVRTNYDMFVEFFVCTLFVNSCSLTLNF